MNALGPGPLPGCDLLYSVSAANPDLIRGHVKAGRRGAGDSDTHCSRSLPHSTGWLCRVSGRSSAGSEGGCPRSWAHHSHPDLISSTDLLRSVQPRAQCVTRTYCGQEGAVSEEPRGRQGRLAAHCPSRSSSQEKRPGELCQHPPLPPLPPGSSPFPSPSSSSSESLAPLEE